MIYGKILILFQINFAMTNGTTKLRLEFLRFYYGNSEDERSFLPLKLNFQTT